MNTNEFHKIFSFYTNSKVYPEIVEYSKGRWIALETKPKDKRIFIRYLYGGGPPLKIYSRDDLIKILIKFRGLIPRTIYGSVNIFKKIVNRSDVEELNNIVYSTPIIDIDVSLDEWKLAIDAAEEIVSIISKYGVDKSIYLKWSGRGIHIHINEKSISEEVRNKYNPIDISYSIVEFILKNSLDRIKPILDKSKSIDRPLKIENKIDIQRVFTVPLSFHRIYDYINVCFKPNDIRNFDLSWIYPESYRHDPTWKIYLDGEADDLALKAIEDIGGYIKKYMTGKKAIVLSAERGTGEKRRKVVKITYRKIGRFQVMALLQAARYYILKRDINKAKSFGLNRAIFYAWAKYHKPKYGVSKYGLIRREMGITPEELPHEKLGDEMAFKSSDGWFMIGDQVQRPSDYDRQIKAKIDPIVPYEIAWDAALEYLKSFPREVLESQQQFYKEAYQPIRDRFVELVIEYMKDKESREA